MKRSKKLYALIGVLLVLSIATFAALTYEEQQEFIKNSDEIILEIPSDSVNKLSWKNETTELEFYKDESWVYGEDEAFPVDSEEINNLLDVFAEFGVAFIIEEVSDYGQYGLDDPICTINMGTEETDYEVLLGDYSTMDSQRYVSIGDGNVYLVQDDPLNYFDAQLSDMICHDDFPRFDTVNKIEFEGNENYSIIYEEESTNTYCEDDVYFAILGDESLPLDTDNVDSYLQNISSLNLTDYVSYNATADEIESYGLNNPELIVTVDYSYEDEDEMEISETFILNIARDPKEQSEVDANVDENETSEEPEEVVEEPEEVTAYARVGESQIVYQLSTAQYNNLKEVTYNDLRHPEVVTVDFDDVIKVDIALDGENYTVTTEGEEEKVYYYDEEEIEIDDFKTALTALKADTFTDELPAKREEISLVLHLDNENYPQTTVELYQYDGTHCLALVDGKAISLIERSFVVDVIESVNAIVLN